MGIVWSLDWPSEQGLADWSKVWFGRTEWSGIGNALAEKTMIDSQLGGGSV